MFDQIAQAFRDFEDRFAAFSDRIAERLETISSGINEIFQRPAQIAFGWSNDLVLSIPPDIEPIVARECAVAFFQIAIIGVLFLRPEYVNVDQPKKSLLYDLRLWTIASMLPHMFIYRFM
ncbi:MAG: hypothetical protein AAB353_05080 [Candidatus Hydrogenedentota bacterium]